MEISRDEYLKALDTVVRYHEQLKQEVRNADPGAIHARDFLVWLTGDFSDNGLEKGSVTKVWYAIRGCTDPLDDINYIDRNTVKGWTGCGNKFWATFEKLRELYKGNQ
ncbi:MAG: hypothetical protein LBL04_15480 [Bacteroidales bacterium]|jgi:hypothetical protein|nr:hypothetical protein [Bacteroidales bacterium]